MRDTRPTATFLLHPASQQAASLGGRGEAGQEEAERAFRGPRSGPGCDPRPRFPYQRSRKSDKVTFLPVGLLPWCRPQVSVHTPAAPRRWCEVTFGRPAGTEAEGERLSPLSPPWKGWPSALVPVSLAPDSRKWVLNLYELVEIRGSF